MCLLTYLPPGIQPDLTALSIGARNNPDGHGFAIVTRRRLLVRKGLNAATVLAAFDRARRAHPGGPALFHSRIGTHGRLNRANCHPFPVGGDPRTVIAHNGILPPRVQPGPGGHRSDTRIAAEDFLPRFGPLHRPATRSKLERWMGPHNLMVLLTVDPRYREQAYLFNEASGTWDDGIWYSNDSYWPTPPRWRSLDDRYRSPSWGRVTTTRGPGLLCEACRAVVDPEEAWCPWCEHCWACGQHPNRCECWTPAALTTSPPQYDAFS